MPSEFGIGFCGAGNIVQTNHLPAVEARPGRLRVVGFYDRVREKAEACAGDRYQAFDSYDALLAAGDLDLVVVATKPIETHFPAAKQALDAGKHVLLEKPMASTTAQCDDLIRLAQKKNVLLTVHHNRRLDLDFLALQDVIDKGKIGQVRLIENRHVSNGYAGGDFVDWGVHLVDQCLLLNRSPLREVSALFANPDGDVEHAGYAEATLRFDDPPLLRLAMLPRPTEFLLNGTPPATRFYAVGTKAAFTQRIIEDIRDLMNATQNFADARPDYVVPPYLEIVQKDFYDVLYETLAHDAPLLVRPEQARNAIRVLELMSESARRNQTVPAEGLLAT